MRVVSRVLNPCGSVPQAVLADQGSQSLSAGAGRSIGRAAQQLVCIGRRQRTAEEESLRFVAVVLLQEQQLSTPSAFTVIRFERYIAMLAAAMARASPESMRLVMNERSIFRRSTAKWRKRPKLE